MRVLKRLFVFALVTAAVLLLFAGAALVYGYYSLSRDLPDQAQIANFELAASSRVYAADGSLLGEFARRRQIYVPIQMVPKHVINSFLAADDRNFYQHGGLDYTGMAQAVYSYIMHYSSNRRARSASTITQQVARNFFLTPERSVIRKIKEALLARRLEEALSKDRILELYLNQIYFGGGNYGVAAASQAYFDKPVSELTIAEAAYLATGPKISSPLHPVRNNAYAIERRNNVIDRLVENGWMTEADAAKARNEPLVIASHRNVKRFAGDYFSEEVRHDVIERYGKTRLYEGGLSVHSTLDPKLQVMARQAMVAGLVNFDESQFYRGAITKIDISGDWGINLAEIRSLSDIAPWRMAVVLETSDQSARIGFQPAREFGSISKNRDTGLITLDGVAWARPTKDGTPATISQILQPGDVIYADPLYKDDRIVEGQYRLRQVPEVSGAMVAMDPWTGRVLAMVGGFSFDQNPFNRAIEAYRPPGSAFKPIVYSAALDNGYTPLTLLFGTPIGAEQGQSSGVWRPENVTSGRHRGPPTLRNALRRSLSLNTVTVRLAQDLGMPLVSDYARRFGVYDTLPNYLSYALGTGETTAMRMVTAYSMFANGGRRVNPTLIDHIQDRYGRTIFARDARECVGCNVMDESNRQNEPQVDRQEQVLDTMTAYQVTRLLQGVVERGTATALNAVGKTIAGKTGTSHEAKDVWFVGFSPEIAVAIYMGYDKPRPLGKGATATGGHLAAPIARDFFKMALADKPKTDFKVPAGITLVSVVARTGRRPAPGETDTIILAFKPGTEPPDNNPIGVPAMQSRPDVREAVPDGNVVKRPDTGGIY